MKVTNVAAVGQAMGNAERKEKTLLRGRGGNSHQWRGQV